MPKKKVLVELAVGGMKIPMYQSDHEITKYVRAVKLDIA
jgi:hypothetical protein